jgi:hypothetical protein
MSHEEDHLAEETRAKMRDEVAALTPVQRREYAKLIIEAEPPPAPDYGSMSKGEFNRIKNGIR